MVEPIVHRHLGSMHQFNLTLSVILLTGCTQTRPLVPSAEPDAVALIGDSEVREYFGLHADSFPVAKDSQSVQWAAITAVTGVSTLGFSPDSSCATTFDAGELWLVYVSPCRREGDSADGDALVGVSRDGHTLGRVLLAPGGIEFAMR